jgi:hypothetical protein
MRAGDLDPGRTIYKLRGTGRRALHLSAHCPILKRADSDVAAVDAGVVYADAAVCTRCTEGTQRPSPPEEKPHKVLEQMEPGDLP